MAILAEDFIAVFTNLSMSWKKYLFLSLIHLFIFQTFPHLMCCNVHLRNIIRHSINRSGYWDHTISDAEWSKHVEDLDLQNIISAANANYEYKTALNRE